MRKLAPEIAGRIGEYFPIPGRQLSFFCPIKSALHSIKADGQLPVFDKSAHRPVRPAITKLLYSQGASASISLALNPRVILVFWFVLATLSATVCASAAERWDAIADTVFENFTPRNGLPNQIVHTLAQDSAGFLWAGTTGGLARFDGYRFRVFKADTQNPDAFSGNNVWCLHNDHFGALWIGTLDAGLSRYDPAKDIFKTIPVGPNGLSHLRVRALADDGTNGLWIGTEGGLDRLDLLSGRIEHLRHDPADPSSLPDDQVRAILTDQTGTLWIGTQKGLALQASQTKEFKAVPLPISGTPFPTILSLMEDHAGRIWIGTEGHGAFVREPGSETFQAITCQTCADVNLNTVWLNSIIEAEPGQIWFASSGQGIIKVDAQTQEVMRLSHDAARQTSLPHNLVYSFLKDRSGLIWVGSIGGLSRNDPQTDGILTIFGETSRDKGLRGRDVISLTKNSDGQIWAGLTPSGIDIINPMIGRVASFVSDPSNPDDALPGAGWAIVPGSNGENYIGTRRGLYQISSGASIRHLQIAKEIDRSPVNSLVFADQALWLGTDLGLWRTELGRSRGALRLGEMQLTDQSIQTLLSDAQGSLWIGTRNGLNRLSDDGKFEQIIPDANDATKIAGKVVSTLVTDGRGRLWVGTLGGGISILEGRDERGLPRFSSLGLKDGLPSAHIATVLKDEKNQIWASTYDGIVSIDPDTRRMRRLGRAEGVIISDYWAASGIETEYGEILFGGKGGITIIRPGRIRPWTYKAPVVITDLWIGNRPAKTSSELTIPSEANSLTVEFAALDYSAPEQNRYSYRLEGYDSDWIETDWTRRLASYTNLPPGQYTLHLRGSNRDGIWAERDLAVPVTVLPAWYQTFWLKLLLAIALAGGVMVLVQARTVYLRKRQLALEALIAHRTKELQQSKVTLENAYAELAQLANRDPLTGLSNRRHFFERADELLAQARRYHRPSCVITADLDHFKQINDAYGHGGGDETLRAAAQCLATSVREVDIVARFGGEEFAVFLAETILEDACIIAERFRAALESLEIHYEGQIISVTASIGVAAWAETEPGIEAALDRADAALYLVKKSGRNGIRAHALL